MSTKLRIAAVAVGAYALVSYLLVRTPLLYPGWRQRFQDKFPYKLSNVAHRGGSLIGPENTIYTFQKALVEGHADMLELDVRISKDGQAVVSHDPTLGRSCGPEHENLAVADIVVGDDPNKTLPQSSRSIPIFFKTKELDTYTATDSIPQDNSTRVCLLSEVFEHFPNTPLHVDIKDADYNFVCKVLDMIAEYKREGITFVGSSNMANKPNLVKYFASHPPEKRSRYRLFANTHDFLLSHVYFYLGILPFIKLDYDVFSVPVYTSTMWNDAVEEYGLITTILGAYFMTSPVMWTHMQHRGIALIGWVLNSEKDYSEAKQWPLNGIMSDDPIHLHRFLDQFERGAPAKSPTPT